MSAKAGRWWLLVWMCLVLGHASAEDSTARPISLLSRAEVDRAGLELSPQERAWLKDRGQLVLGTASPDYPPFVISSSLEDYEGVSADYLGIISRWAGVEVVVRRYTDPQSARDALAHGEIDLLADAAPSGRAHASFSSTEPYAVDQPVLVTRVGKGVGLAPDLAGKKLLMLAGYMAESELKRLFPGARVELINSTREAMSALAFGQADAFLSDLISSSYLITHFYLNTLAITHLDGVPIRGFAFSIRPQDRLLGEIINRALSAVSVIQREAILKRWGAGANLRIGANPLLTSEEQDWIAANPVVHVQIDDYSAPLSFFDAQGNFHGVTADILGLINLRTGLQFLVERGHGTSPEIKPMRQTAIVSWFDRRRIGNALMTRPFLFNPVVLVVRADQDRLRSLGGLAGKRLALVRDHPLIPMLRAVHPHIQIVETVSLLDALALVDEQCAEAAISPLRSAGYYIAQAFADDLKVVARVGSEPARMVFSLALEDTLLHSIIDKALLSIPPDEMATLSGRWRTAASVDRISWYSYRPLILQIVGVASLLLLVSLAWNGYLRRQIRLRHAAERALSDQLEFMQALVNGVPQPIYVRDRQRRLMMCNDSYLALLDIKREQALGMRAVDGLFKDHHQAARFHADYERVMQQATAMQGDRELYVSGRHLTIFHWIQPFCDSVGDVKGVIGGCVDITERRRLVEQLRTAKEHADASSQAKTVFLATMSHEIRTPLNAVIGMLELVLERHEQGHLDYSAIEVAHDSAIGLLALIGDILDIARIETGHLNLEPERAAFGDLVGSVLRIFDGLARQKGLQLCLDIEPEACCDVWVDPIRFKQVLSNLVSNAIKFTDQGHVSIQVQVLAADKDFLQVTLIVADTGIGISRADQDRLFQPFSQVMGNGQASAGGAGLGLLISRTLCEMMGGKLAMTSELRQGTQVSIELRLGRLPPAAARTIEDSPCQTKAPTSLNVLVVDDHPVNRMLLSQQVSFIGHQVTAAADGAQALQLWQSQPFDLVITDCNMPVMDGYQLARVIRSLECERRLPSCSIFGFTANALPEERGRCMAAGMDDCLFKPVSLASLGARLRLLAPRPSSHGDS